MIRVSIQYPKLSRWLSTVWPFDANVTIAVGLMAAFYLGVTIGWLGALVSGGVQ
jgi:hypothetical protein